MGDAETLAAGVFVSAWLVTFFSYSALQLRRGYGGGTPGTKTMDEREVLPRALGRRPKRVIADFASRHFH